MLERFETMRVLTLAFSRDRAMQLEATLRSVLARCQDHDLLDFKILYTTSSDREQRQYDELIEQYKQVAFLREVDFRTQVLTALDHYNWVLFLVDDNVFVRDFHLMPALLALNQRTDALGISLRLGRNTTYCYPLNARQRVPKMRAVMPGLLQYRWVRAAHDFGYPLEVSSSLYRVADLWALLNELDFRNPNTLEGLIAGRARQFAATHPMLLCYEQSVTFCNPANVVQTVCDNRAGQDPRYSAQSLADRFDRGERVDLTPLHGYVPRGCHEEVPFQFVPHAR